MLCERLQDIHLATTNKQVSEQSLVSINFAKGLLILLEGVAISGLGVHIYCFWQSKW